MKRTGAVVNTFAIVLDRYLPMQHEFGVVPLCERMYGEFL